MNHMDQNHWLHKPSEKLMSFAVMIWQQNMSSEFLHNLSNDMQDKLVKLIYWGMRKNARDANKKDIKKYLLYTDEELGRDLLQEWQMMIPLPDFIQLLNRVKKKIRELIRSKYIQQGKEVETEFVRRYRSKNRRQKENIALFLHYQMRTTFMSDLDPEEINEYGENKRKSWLRILKKEKALVKRDGYLYEKMGTGNGLGDEQEFRGGNPEHEDEMPSNQSELGPIIIPSSEEVYRSRWGNSEWFQKTFFDDL